MTRLKDEVYGVWDGCLSNVVVYGHGAVVLIPEIWEPWPDTASSLPVCTRKRLGPSSFYRRTVTLPTLTYDNGSEYTKHQEVSKG